MRQFYICPSAISKGLNVSKNACMRVRAAIDMAIKRRLGLRLQQLYRVHVPCCAAAPARSGNDVKSVENTKADGYEQVRTRKLSKHLIFMQNAYLCLLKFSNLWADCVLLYSGPTVKFTQLSVWSASSTVAGAQLQAVLGVFAEHGSTDWGI